MRPFDPRPPRGHNLFDRPEPAWWAYARALRDSGLKTYQIAERLGRSQRGVENALSSNPRPKTTQRQCMCCGISFESTGPGNRLCAHCRTKSATCFEVSL